MKSLILITTVLSLLSASYAQPFTVKGSVSGTAPKLIRFSYSGKSGQRIQDSSTIVNGSFSFHGDMDGAQMVYLFVGKGYDEKHVLSFFLEPTAVSVALPGDDFSKAKVTGSRLQDEYETLKTEEAPIREAEKPLSEKFRKANEAYMAAIKAKKSEAELDTLKYRAAAIHDQFDPYNERIAQIEYKFFDAHPQSLVTATFLSWHVNDLSLDSLKLFYGRLGSAIQTTGAGKAVAEEIEKLQAGSPGSTAKDFAAVELHGDTFRLSTLKGKYVLIDFWASWCVPCRKSMPHVKELYARYKDKGFDVVAVSDDDRDSTAWIHAIQKDGTGEWHNVLRGLDMKKIMAHEPNPSDISEKFGIHSLPTKILIDPRGQIIGRYDKGTDEEAEALDKELAQVLH